jgi:hypothetical protein
LFSGIPVASHTLPGSDGKPHNLTIYELEPRDVPVLKNIQEHIRQHRLLPLSMPLYPYLSHNLILYKALREVQAMLTLPEREHYQPAKAFLAVSENQPCGVGLGNLAKQTAKGGIVYSNRAKAGETELDWLSTWPINGGTRLKGTGQVLMAHLFNFFQTLPVNSIFLRSQPIYTKADPFYLQLGFSRAGKLRPCEGDWRPHELTRIAGGKPYIAYTGDISPMKMSIPKAKEVMADLFEKFPPHWQAAPSQSLDLHLEKAVLPKSAKRFETQPTPRAWLHKQEVLSTCLAEEDRT